MFNIAKVTHEWAKQEGNQAELFETIESTNEVAKSSLEELTSSPAFYFAETQSNGKGRGGNKWISPNTGEGLLCSITFKLEKPPQQIASPCFGWAVYKAFKETFDLDFSVKAPNDIYIKDKKLAGILIEAVTKGDEHFLIFGLGINVFSHPNIDNSSALTDFLEDQDIEENQWLNFFSMLSALCSQASIECQSEVLSEAIKTELQDALYKYEGNRIKTLEENGSFILENDELTHWRDL